MALARPVVRCLKYAARPVGATFYSHPGHHGTLLGACKYFKYLDFLSPSPLRGTGSPLFAPCTDLSSLGASSHRDQAFVGPYWKHLR